MQNIGYRKLYLFGRDIVDKIIPLVTIKEQNETDKILSALENNNIYSAEITFRTEFAADAIAFAAKNFPHMHVGAGTVIDAEQCRQALDAGAEFIVSPGLSVSVAEICGREGIPYYPGCVTPTEIMRALEFGITIVKYFPANLYGGLNAMKALAAPFPQIKFIPTGGINRKNMAEYLAWEKTYAVGGSFFTEEALQKWERS